MRVLYVEGVAIRDGPESCVGAREGVGEALTGVLWAGRLSREIRIWVLRLSPWRKAIPAEAVTVAEGNTWCGASASHAGTRRGP
jgi:hypothetical protein